MMATIELHCAIFSADPAEEAPARVGEPRVVRGGLDEFSRCVIMESFKEKVTKEQPVIIDRDRIRYSKKIREGSREAGGNRGQVSLREQSCEVRRRSGVRAAQSNHSEDGFVIREARANWAWNKSRVDIGKEEVEEVGSPSRAEDKLVQREGSHEVLDRGGVRRGREVGGRVPSERRKIEIPSNKKTAEWEAAVLESSGEGRQLSRRKPIAGDKAKVALPTRYNTSAALNVGRREKNWKSS
jgi:hypothetical protein